MAKRTPIDQQKETAELKRIAGGSGVEVDIRGDNTTLHVVLRGKALRVDYWPATGCALLYRENIKFWATPGEAVAVAAGQSHWKDYEGKHEPFFRRLARPKAPTPEGDRLI